MNDKYNWWRCARCGGRFLVTEPMHSCYQRAAAGVAVPAPARYPEHTAFCCGNAYNCRQPEKSCAMRGDVLGREHERGAPPGVAVVGEGTAGEALDAIVGWAIGNRCGCNHWTTPKCPERNCSWQGKRPVDVGVAPCDEAQRLAMEACRLLCAAAVVQENPDKVVCPPAFVVAVRAAMLALRADGVAIPDGSRDALDPTRGEVKP